MNEYFGFRNLRQFEQKHHEVRLPCDLLNDERFRRLADAQKAHLICLLLLAARMGNLLPNRPAKLGSLIGATEPIEVAEFADFIRFSRLESGQAGETVEGRPLSDRLGRSCWFATAGGAGVAAVPETSRSTTSFR